MIRQTFKKVVLAATVAAAALAAPLAAQAQAKEQFLPLLLNQVPHLLGIPLSVATASHLEFMIFGALIVFFLVVEPHGLARLWSTGKEKLRLWPFPH